MGEADTSESAASLAAATTDFLVLVRPNDFAGVEKGANLED